MKKKFDFFDRVRRGAKKRKPMTVTSMGRERVFDGYDWGTDTFAFERGTLKEGEDHQPILLVRKSDLSAGASGYVMTVSSGNHAVAALPLLKGQLWSLGRVLSAEQQSEVMAKRVLCANLVGGKIEISQRDVPTPLVVAADEWLQSLELPLDALVMLERNTETLKHYQRLGQAWRVRPLARTTQEMEVAIRASRKHINSSLQYYHSARGVHFLSYAAFHSLLELSRSDYGACLAALRELVSTFDGREVPLRLPKYQWHHEIELFGLRRDVALKKDGFVPKLERLMSDITVGKRMPDATVRKISQQEVCSRLMTLDAVFRASLERPELADVKSKSFIETLYMHLTGAIYEGEPGAVLLAFDDRRTALPGATYNGGKPTFHPGADRRTRTLLANLNLLLASKDEQIEFVNISELRTHEGVKLGEGVTREVEFKTNRRPLCTSRIEKRLKEDRRGYGSYLMARVYAFKALGVKLGEYRLLTQEESPSREEVTHFLRTRSPGFPLDGIPELNYKTADGKRVDANVLYTLGTLLGDAAAQNLAMKKYVDEREGCRFGVGKEIFEFAYAIESGREMPVRVGLCSVRGALGWPDVSKDEQNLKEVFDFYLERYAKVLVAFWRKHRNALDFEKLVSRFLDGFEQKTREMNWAYTARNEQFNAFDPKVLPGFLFKEKWSFALWALVRQEECLDQLKVMFAEKAMDIETEDYPDKEV